ncbi:hypothetical protein PMM47T1_25303 [Pseudomonas sp. M47T1]|uniref:hypothetical protein n=1 Tax=Pseudomonas sp. M47T1 TaxID=1179778 RepID=UPI000260837B|nr:hypothetical protein [Pseudomonas sp. M47T1]EIK93788.1 hypothetical protein PMM47T1_25303 [Pseudomonas sp. M47T1]
MNDEFERVTDSMRDRAMRLRDGVLQAPGDRRRLKSLRLWLRQDDRHRLALRELRQLMEIVPDDPVGLLNRMVSRLPPLPALH